MYIYGAGGHAKVIIEILEAQGVNVRGVFDDNPNGEQLLGYPLFEGYRLKLLEEDRLIIAIGDNVARQRVVERLGLSVDNFGTAVHPNAIVSKRAKIGKGTVVMQGAVINSCTCIGVHSIVNTGATMDHDGVIGDFCHISPHATLCGAVTVGDCTQIGAGSVVIPGVHIGSHTLIGAGSVVVNDIPDNVLAYGNPCRIVRMRR